MRTAVTLSLAAIAALTVFAAVRSVGPVAVTLAAPPAPAPAPAPVATVAAATDAQPDRPAVRSAPALVSAAGIRRAQAYARSRAGHVAFAVLDASGRLRGLHRTDTFPSASVVKAMLLVAVLRRAGSQPISAGEKALLDPMITESDNDAAIAVFNSVGRAGLYSVAKVAGMRKFSVGALFDAQLTAADQARFFLHIDRLVPAAHRAYARKLLSSIIPAQRWGIAPVAHARGFKAFFKGGWRTGIVHQVALLERGGRRISLAILTSGEPSMQYGEETLAGIAARVLTRP